MLLMKNKLGPLFLFLMFVGLPLGSWYYLKKGFEYHKSTYERLKNYGNFPQFSVDDQFNAVLTKDSLIGHLTLVGTVFPEKGQDKSKWKDLNNIVSQFRQSDHLKVLLLDWPQTSTPTQERKNLLEGAGFKSTDKVFYASGPNVPGMMKSLGIPDVKNRKNDKDSLIVNHPENIKAYDPYPYFALLDTEGRIRNYYHTEDADQMKRLVEQIAILLPRKKVKKPIVKREKEK